METGFFSNKQARLLGLLTLLMLIIALGSYAMVNFEKLESLDLNPATISVSGEGEMLAVPDVAQFSFSVTAKEDTANAAQEASGTKIDAILAYLAEQGIEEKDIKTQNYNLYPNWRYEERVCLSNSFCPPGERVQDGFTVSQSVMVKVREVDRAGEIIAGVGEREATDISSLNFTVDDTDALKEEARAKAIADAKAKAEVLAEQLGVRIISIAGYYEGGGDFGPVYAESRALAFDSAEDEGFGGAKLPVGEESTKVTVNITYKVR